MCEVDFEGDQWHWWQQTPRTAKKTHRCNTCGLGINPGEPYLDHRHIDSDGLHAAKACGPCGISLKNFGDAHGFWTSPEGILEFLRDCIVHEDEKGGWRDDVAGIIRRNRIARRAASHGEEREP